MNFGSRFVDLDGGEPHALEEDVLKNPLYANGKLFAEAKAMKSDRKVDTNVMLFNFGCLNDIVPLIESPPIACKSCKAIFSQLSKAPKGKWTCEYCGQSQEIKLPKYLSSLSSSPAIEFLLSAPSGPPQESIIVFCLDISGSMSVTSAVQSTSHKDWNCSACTYKNLGAVPHCSMCGGKRPSGKVEYVSRLQAMQTAVETQLKFLKSSHPRARVLLVAFNDNVVILGDGSDVPVCLSDLYDFDQLLLNGKGYPVSKRSITDSAEILKVLLGTLMEAGQTALGPALLVSVGMASHAPLSQVVVFTDGLSTVGLGEMSASPSDIERQYINSYYQRVGDEAIKNGVAISIITIQEEECNLSILGALAERTGGETHRVKPTEIVNSMSSIVHRKLLGSNVVASFLMCTRLMAYQGGLPAKVLFGLNGEARALGCVALETEKAFQFGVVPPKMKLGGKVPDVGDQMPFQMQVNYRRADGAVCLRVLVTSIRVAQSCVQAEMASDPPLVAAAGLQIVARLIQDGLVEEARNLTLRYRDYGARLRKYEGGDDGSNDVVYDNMVKNMGCLYESCINPLSDQSASHVFHFSRASSRRVKKSELSDYELDPVYDDPSSSPIHASSSMREPK